MKTPVEGHWIRVSSSRHLENLSNLSENYFDAEIALQANVNSSDWIVERTVPLKTLVCCSFSVLNRQRDTKLSAIDWKSEAQIYSL